MEKILYRTTWDGETHGPFRGFTTSGARICPSSLAPFSLLGTRTCSEKRYPKHVWVVLWLLPRNHGKFHVAAGQRKDVKKLETNLAKTKKQSLTILYGTRRAFFLSDSPILIGQLANFLQLFTIEVWQAIYVSFRVRVVAPQPELRHSRSCGHFCSEKNHRCFTAIHPPNLSELRIKDWFLRYENRLRSVFFSPFDPGEQWIWIVQQPQRQILEGAHYYNYLSTIH